MRTGDLRTSGGSGRSGARSGSRGVRTLALTLGVLLVGVLARADTARALDLDGLADRAEWIVRGRVVETRAFRPEVGPIRTEVRLALERTFARPAAEGDEPPEAATELVFRLPGGVLPDGHGLVLPGLPRMAAGDDVLLFLSRESRAGLRVPVGAAQGAFFLRADEDGVVRVRRRLGTLQTVDASGAAVASTAGRAETRDELEREVEAAVDRARERARAAERERADGGR